MENKGTLHLSDVDTLLNGTDFARLLEETELVAAQNRWKHFAPKVGSVTTEQSLAQL